MQHAQGLFLCVKIIGQRKRYGGIPPEYSTSYLKGATMIRFRIPKPCNEDWESMQQAENGRFCAVCQKCVVDLSGMSGKQIGEVYAKNGGQVCGRMDQPKLIQPKNQWLQLSGIQRFAIAFLVAFGFFTFQPSVANAQDEWREIKTMGVVMADIPEGYGPRGHLFVTVTGPAGKELKGNVGILVRKMEGEEFEFQLTTNEGWLQLDELEPGKYVVGATQGKEKVWKTFEVMGGEVSNIHLELEEVPVLKEPENKCKEELEDQLQPQSAKGEEDKQPVLAWQKEWTLFPNPTSGRTVSLRLENEERLFAHILVYNANGQVVGLFFGDFGEGMERNIDLYGLGAGTYMVVMEWEGGKTAKKLVLF